MPRIFEKDCKINIIEYGENCQQSLSLLPLKNSVVASVKNFLRIA